MSLSKSCFYNYLARFTPCGRQNIDRCTLHYSVDQRGVKKSTSKEGQPKNDSAKYIKNHNQPKSGPANTIFVCKNSAKYSIRNIHALAMIE